MAFMRGDAPRRRTLPFILLVGLNVAGMVGAGGCLYASDLAPTVIAAHAACMMVAWGTLLPLGGILARYFKVTPRQDFPAVLDNLFWWNMHRLLQYSGIAVATVGLCLILSESGGRFDTQHGRLGLLVMSVAWLQVASPLIRGSKGGPTDSGARPDEPQTWRGDHFDMTLRRRIFEAWHKPAGWGLILLGSVTILLGASLLGAPAWLFLLIGVAQAALVLAVTDCCLRHRWVDTHTALWGPGAWDSSSRGGAKDAPALPRRGENRRASPVGIELGSERRETDLR